MDDLNGKVAVVADAGRGIGRAIAEAYLRAGARVTSAREHGEIESLATETGMTPAGLPEEARGGLLRPGGVATEWSPEDPDGRPASEGLGGR